MSDLKDQDTLISHLIELRIRLVRAVLAIAIATGLSGFYVDEIFRFVCAPIQKFLAKQGASLVFTGVMDKFMAYFKVAVIAGVVLSCPFWLYQVWKFVEPALHRHEKRVGRMFIFFGSLLFISGVAFVYFIVFDFTFDYLLNVGGDDLIKPMINLADYLSFFVMMCLVFGASFELPLVLAILALMGLVDDSLLRKNRRFAIVGMAIVAAVITPPDPMSMMFTLVPMMVLYEISVFLVARIAKGVRLGKSLGAV